MTRVIPRNCEIAECRICDEYVAYGATLPAALQDLAEHMKNKHPQESARAQRLIDQQEAEVIAFPQGK